MSSLRKTREVTNRNAEKDFRENDRPQWHRHFISNADLNYFEKVIIHKTYYSMHKESGINVSVKNKNCKNYLLSNEKISLRKL